MKKCLSLPRWSDILLEIYKSQNRNNYCQKLNGNVKGSISYLRDVVKLLAKANLISIESGNKIKRIFLTEKGKMATAAILDLKSALR